MHGIVKLEDEVEEVKESSLEPPEEDKHITVVMLLFNCSFHKY